MRQIMKLSDILDIQNDTEITGITADSREISQGFVFGSLNDESYITDAISKGAVAVITNKAYSSSFDNVIMIKVDNPAQVYAKAVAKYFGKQPKHMAAITGTNGKTSIADFVRQIINSIGRKAASIGTLGIIKNNLSPIYLPNTTPNNVTLHKNLYTLATEGYDHVILEASSHGLDQCRLGGCSFDVAGFTNLTRDHLDYHQTLDNYFKAKMILFQHNLKKGGYAVLNADIKEFAEIEKICQTNSQQIISYGTNGQDIKLLKSTPTAQGQILDLIYFGNPQSIEIPLVGQFQAMNILCAAGIAVAMTNQKNDVLKSLSLIKGAKGRLEFIGTTPNNASIFIDYAHTPDAIEQILKALRPHTQQNLKILFGCGGNRDKGKRPIMGKIANDLADEIFITDDNPRFEDANIIREEIIASCPKGINIPDRAVAIAQAIASLKSGDVLVIAGKGHETGQYIQGNIIPFSDHEEVIKNLS